MIFSVEWLLFEEIFLLMVNLLVEFLFKFALSVLGWFLQLYSQPSEAIPLYLPSTIYLFSIFSETFYY